MKIASFLVLFFVALVFSGCGFSPVYGSEANTTLPEVTLGQIEGKYAYLLDQSLRTRLRARGQSADAGGQWILSYTVSEESQPLGINEKASSTYSMLTVNATYTVTRASNNTILVQRSRRQRQGYDIVTSTYGSDQSLADARSKAIDTLADAIIQDLVFLSKKDYKQPTHLVP
ncbi:MAG: LPS assembly lipoprotein LptE [Alphaproteobacteria bacterium]